MAADGDPDRRIAAGSEDDVPSSDASSSSCSAHLRAALQSARARLQRPARGTTIVHVDSLVEASDNNNNISAETKGAWVPEVKSAITEEVEKLLLKENAKSKNEITSMPFENVSMDKDDVHSEVAHGLDSEMGISELIRRPVFVKWFITAVIAVVMAIQCAIMLMFELEAVRWKIDLFFRLWQNGQPGAAFAVLLGYGLFAGTISASLVLFVSLRAASSGIPDTKAFLNGNHIPGFLAARTWFARTFALMLVTSAGLFAGTEGPLFGHLGAIISCGLARGRFTVLGRRIRLPWKFSGFRAQRLPFAIESLTSRLVLHAMSVSRMSYALSLALGALVSKVAPLLLSLPASRSSWCWQLNATGAAIPNIDSPYRFPFETASEEYFELNALCCMNGSSTASYACDDAILCSQELDRPSSDDALANVTVKPAVCPTAASTTATTTTAKAASATISAGQFTVPSLLISTVLVAMAVVGVVM
ncbi:unnamed protein product [Polarella glacialis]|uniref:Chloride channel protein n=1 Tax=Polarella glacialis TaxID=89957 RepID=A0A813FJK3_POLGL|nr:unnamed protein product [Polarella glacialis]